MTQEQMRQKASEARREAKALQKKMQTVTDSEERKVIARQMNELFAQAASLRDEAKHRGLRSDKGFVQIGLSAEWGTAHLEWIPISAKRMCLGNEYQLELHVENNKALADKWREELNSNPILLPANKCEKVKAGTSRLLRYKRQTSKPIAKMSKKELTEFLTGVYTKELNYCCRMLVEHFHDYI